MTQTPTEIRDYLWRMYPKGETSEVLAALSRTKIREVFASLFRYDEKYSLQYTVNAGEAYLVVAALQNELMRRAYNE